MDRPTLHFPCFLVMPGVSLVKYIHFTWRNMPLTETLTVVIPMAGWGTRMRPHTWSKPKPLVSVAGKATLDHLMDLFHTLPASLETRYIFIVGPYLGERQVPAHIKAHYPHINARYVLQAEMKGQSHALYLAREYLHGPMLMIFSDTLIETDFASLAEETADGVAWVKPVPDPRRFGVAEVDGEGNVTRLIEKPDTMENNLAVVGCYYFREAEALMAAIEEQMRRDVQLKNEYFLADAINIMLERGARFRTQQVSVWLDTGTPEATLETNRYLLEHGRANTPTLPEDVTVIPPVFVHPTATVTESTLGPNASVGPNCRIVGSRVAESILEEGVEMTHIAVEKSIIGRQARVRGRGADAPAVQLNIGDNSSVRL
ncbi:MAG: nucleotidyltransferase [Anaerolineae bacterium]|nr:MAG: nucleotidyltransferase [Anaerolineae bacterium]